MIRRGIGVQPYTVGSSFIGLLDTYTDAAAAYSVRKLRAAYTGSAIRVRRSSDNTEQDIGFDGNGNLDESALTTFVGANNGFVTTWYDQSGNSRNATQSTALNQCQIVSSGNVIKDNNKPALNFDGSNDFFSITALTTTNSVYSVFNVSKMNNVSANNSIFAGVAGSFQLRYQAPFLQMLRQQQATLYTSAIKTTSKQYLNSIFTANTGISLYMNGVLDNSNATNPAFTQGITRIGAQAAPAEFFIGPFQELIIYTSSQTSNRTGIESNINTYYSIY